MIVRGSIFKAEALFNKFAVMDNDTRYFGL